MEQTRAWEQLHDAEACGHLNAEEMLELCRRAGYSEEASQKAATQRANARLDRGLEP